MINIRRCEYVKTDGQLCGSPALKTRRYCYFHYEVNRTVAHLDIPPLEDGDAIQLALTDLARALLEDRIALKPAALLAYILQTASANLKHVHLGIHTDRMITELPDRDPYAHGLAPLPGERNRDPDHAALSEGHDFNPARTTSPSPSSAETASASSAVQGSAPRPSAGNASASSAVRPLNHSVPAPEGRSRIAQGVSPGREGNEEIRTALPKASAQPAGAAPKQAPSASIHTKIAAARSGSLKDTKELLDLVKQVS